MHTIFEIVKYFKTYIANIGWPLNNWMHSLQSEKKYCLQCLNNNSSFLWIIEKYFKQTINTKANTF